MHFRFVREILFVTVTFDHPVFGSEIVHVGEKFSMENFQWKFFWSRFGEKYKYGVCLKPSQYDMF